MQHRTKDVYVQIDEFPSSSPQTTNQQYTTSSMSGPICATVTCHNGSGTELSFGENGTQLPTQEVPHNAAATTINPDTTEVSQQGLQQTTVDDPSSTALHTQFNRSSVSGHSEADESSSHLSGLGGSPVGDSSNSGQAVVPEGAREVTEDLESPPVSPPPQYDALPVTVTEQLRVVMMGAQPVPGHVTTISGEFPPTYEEVMGLPPLSNSACPHVQGSRDSGTVPASQGIPESRKEGPWGKVAFFFTLLVILIIVLMIEFQET